jgi:hypothetical protein
MGSACERDDRAGHLGVSRSSHSYLNAITSQNAKVNATLLFESTGLTKPCHVVSLISPQRRTCNHTTSTWGNTKYAVRAKTSLCSTDVTYSCRVAKHLRDHSRWGHHQRKNAAQRFASPQFAKDVRRRDDDQRSAVGFASSSFVGHLSDAVYSPCGPVKSYRAAKSTHACTTLVVHAIAFLKTAHTRLPTENSRAGLSV